MTDQTNPKPTFGAEILPTVADILNAQAHPVPTFAQALDADERAQLDARAATAEQERDDALDDLRHTKADRDRLNGLQREAEADITRLKTHLNSEQARLRGHIERTRGERDQALASRRRLLDDMNALTRAIGRQTNENDNLRQQLDAYCDHGYPLGGKHPRIEWCGLPRDHDGRHIGGQGEAGFTDTGTVRRGLGSSRRAQDADAELERLLAGMLNRDIQPEPTDPADTAAVDTALRALDRFLTVVNAATQWRTGWADDAGQTMPHSQIRDLIVAVDELLANWPGIDLSIPAVSIAEVAAEQHDIPTNAGAYHWGRAWAPSDIEAKCPCPKAPCGYVIRDQESPDCDQHNGNRTMRGGHSAERCAEDRP